MKTLNLNYEWQIRRLSEVADINPKKEDLGDEETVSFIAMEDISNEGRLLNTQNRLYGEVKKGYTAFRDNDVLLAKITPCFENGKRALVKNLKNSIGFGSTEFHVIRAKQQLTIPQYLYYTVSAHRFKELAEANMTGSAGQKRVPTDFIRDYSILVPPLQEQQKIADILSTVDEQIDNVDRLIEKTKELKKGLMQQLLTKGIGHTEFKETEVGVIPKAWEVKKLGEIGEIVTGSTPKSSVEENYGSQYSWAAPGDLGEHKYISNTNKMLSQQGYDTTRKLPVGSILVTCIGSTIGKIGIAAQEMSTNQQINSIVCSENVNNEFIYYCVDYNFSSYASFISTQAVPIINKTTFSSFLIQLPPPNEQVKIANILVAIDEKIEKLVIKKEQLQQLKKGLIQQLLTDKIRVKVDEV